MIQPTHRRRWPKHRSGIITNRTPSTRRSFLSPPFVACGAVLLVAAIGLHPALAALTKYYSKEVIAIRKSLDDLDLSRLASYQVMPGYVDLVGTLAADLGTEDWIQFCLAKRGSENADRRDRDRDLVLFVTYYSDPRDGVPHTPEVCYRQGGKVVRSIRTISLDTPGLAPDNPKIRARVLDMVDENNVRIALVYLFCCNGRFYFDRERLRLAIGMPSGDKYTYFSKVEVITMVTLDETFEDAVGRCKQLLTDALPILVTDHYPATRDLKRR